MTEDSVKQQHRNPYTPWFVVSAFVAPVVLAYLVFFFADVSSFTNRGEIFKPVIAIETLGLKDETGKVIPKDELTFKWRLYSFVGASCDEACNKRLHEIRQMHATLGKDRHRLFRVIVHLEQPDEALTALIAKEYPDAMRMYADEQTLLSAIKNNAQLRNNELYITDPMGNMMMRFKNDQPIKDVRFDFRKLLKASQIG